jgi:hypothetical protein
MNNTLVREILKEKVTDHLTASTYEDKEKVSQQVSDIKTWMQFYNSCHKAAAAFTDPAIRPNSPICHSHYYLYNLALDYFSIFDCPDQRLPQDIPAIDDSIIDQEYYLKCKSVLEEFHNWNSDLLTYQALKEIPREDKETRKSIVHDRMQNAGKCMTRLYEMYEEYEDKRPEAPNE